MGVAPGVTQDAAALRRFDGRDAVHDDERRLEARAMAASWAVDSLPSRQDIIVGSGRARPPERAISRLIRRAVSGTRLA
jgi:hypothetical protein